MECTPSRVRSNLIRLRYKAPAVTLFVIQHPEEEAIKLVHANFDGKNGPVKLHRAVQFNNRDIKPNGSVMGSIEFTHGFFGLLKVLRLVPKCLRRLDADTP